MPKATSKSEYLKLAAVWLVIIAAWEGAYRVVGWKPDVFPAPSHVLDATLYMLGANTSFGEPLSPHWPRPAPLPDGTPAQLSKPMAGVLPYGVLVSLVRLVVGFAIALTLGMLLGIAMWRFRFVDKLTGPLALGLQTLPSVCWAPLAVLMFPLNESGVIFVTVMGSLFAIAIALRDGLRATPPIYRLAGLMLGARGWRLYRHVLLPAALPALTSSLRQGFSFAWRSLMGGELMLMALDRHGLGFLLQNGRDFGDVAAVIAVMIVMVVIGMLADRLVFAKLELRVRERFGLV